MKHRLISALGLALVALFHAGCVQESPEESPNDRYIILDLAGAEYPEAPPIVVDSPADPMENPDAGTGDADADSGAENPPPPAPCLPQPPAGWDGPFVVAESACPEGAPLRTGFTSASAAPSAGCACAGDYAPAQCGYHTSPHFAFVSSEPWNGQFPAPVNPSPITDPTQSPLLSAWADIPAGAASGDCVNIAPAVPPLPNGVSTRRFINAHTMDTTPPTVAAVVDPILLEPVGSTTLLECSAPADVGFCAPGVSAPAPAGSFCVAADGDQACPGGYPVKTITHAEIGDTRACAPCACAVTGGPVECRADVSMYRSPGCVGGSFDPSTPDYSIAIRGTDDVYGSSNFTGWIGDSGLASLKLGAPFADDPHTFQCSGGGAIGSVELGGDVRTICCR